MKKTCSAFAFAVLLHLLLILLMSNYEPKPVKQVEGRAIKSFLFRPSAKLEANGLASVVSPVSDHKSTLEERKLRGEQIWQKATQLEQGEARTAKVMDQTRMPPLKDQPEPGTESQKPQKINLGNKAAVVVTASKAAPMRAAPTKAAPTKAVPTKTAQYNAIKANGLVKKTPAAGAKIPDEMFSVLDGQAGRDGALAEAEARKRYTSNAFGASIQPFPEGFEHGRYMESDPEQIIELGQGKRLVSVKGSCFMVNKHVNSLGDQVEDWLFSSGCKHVPTDDDLFKAAMESTRK